jgi:hypothetical protein
MGGAIDVFKCFVSISGSSFAECKSFSGGCLFLQNSSIYLNNCSFANSASYDSGGAIAFFGNGNNLFLTIEYSLFSQNSAGVQGGGLFLSTSSRSMIIGTIFDNNIASNGNGGAIFAQITSSSIHLIGSLCIRNSASLFGGCLYSLINGSNVNAESVNFLNRAEVHYFLSL